MNKFLLSLTALGAAAGSLYAGLVGSAMGAGLGLAIGLVSRRSAEEALRALGDPAAPDVRQLEPQQALKIMSARLGRGPASALLERIEMLFVQFEGDPEGTLAQLQALERDHPQSAALWTAKARMLARTGATVAAAEALQRALTLALDSGAQPLAANLYVELEHVRDGITLAPEHTARLAKILDYHGHRDLALQCRQKLASA